MTTLESLQQRVREYTSRHPELAAAHHYDFGLLLAESVKYYVIGLSPGETEEERRLHPGVGHLNPHDPRDWHGLPRNAKSWLTRCKSLLGTDELLLGDVFFWSSPDMASFKQRFGTELRRSPHLSFCREMTEALLGEYMPKGVVFMGLGHADFLRETFGLTEIRRFSLGRKELRHMQDGKRPWFVVPHPNSFPTSADWQTAARYIAANS